MYTDNLMPLPGRSYFNIRVTCISVGPTGEFWKLWEIFKTLGNSLRPNFQDMADYFIFFLFLIVQTTFVPNFMFLGPYFTILLRKT